MRYVRLSVHLMDKIWSTYTISSFISVSQSSVEDKEIEDLVRIGDDADSKGDNSFISHSQSN